ncbi:DUF4336 domain-containing protein [Spirulina subsalsa]|uniref:DUF4336 domain-containing protein n=1 Tax=Spirulina subsalsa TaxID=54311 RepID=UPI0002D73310|nr:DUF4336 domain-containing protein [Spirulina subsalsa]
MQDSPNPSYTNPHPQALQTQDIAWPFWFLVPIYPYGQRKTLFREVVKGEVWIFEQLQGIFYVVVPIRMTVVRLEEGGLLVYAPVAPTRECLQGVGQLEAQYGSVKYIIMPTISGIEHKVFVAPFARHFPTAQIYVAPNQWSFPVNLPLSWLGLPPRRTHILPQDSREAPFAGQFDYAILDTIELGPGRFSEVVFLDRRSRTLLVTDSLVSIPQDPPEILQLNPYPLLFHARDSAFDPIQDTPQNRRKGWQRISLFAFYFQPSVLEVAPWSSVFREATKAPERSKKAYFGLFPFRWKPNWQESFNQLQGGGQLRVAPILQTLILNRAPEAVLNWADQIARWSFDQIIPCHLAAPIITTPWEFRQAFNFLQGHSGLPDADMAFMRRLDQGLAQRGITPPPKV